MERKIVHFQTSGTQRRRARIQQAMNERARVNIIVSVSPSLLTVFSHFSHSHQNYKQSFAARWSLPFTEDTRDWKKTKLVYFVRWSMVSCFEDSLVLLLNWFDSHAILYGQRIFLKSHIEWFFPDFLEILVLCTYFLWIFSNVKFCFGFIRK